MTPVISMLGRHGPHVPPPSFFASLACAQTARHLACSRMVARHLFLLHQPIFAPEGDAVPTPFS